MARAPDGTTRPDVSCGDLTAEEAAYTAGLVGVIDRALQGCRPGERFVYGLHDSPPPAVARCLVERYRAAGWSEARILPGATGAATLVLAP